MVLAAGVAASRAKFPFDSAIDVGEFWPYRARTAPLQQEIA
jgi:hypothetical protein